MGTLYVVATPIGNLEDITERALRILRSVDIIACEDTRRTKILLDRYDIHKTLVSFHQHSKLQKLDFLLDQLQAGKSVALVTDAGTPGISDPGSVLVEKAQVGGHTVVPIPGSSALIAAASVAGIPMDRFLFLGFLPHKKGRKTAVEDMLKSEYPVIFYESPHRIAKTLAAIAAIDPFRNLIICRELTKQFEEIVRGGATTLLERFANKKNLGEFVIIVAPS